MGKKFSYLSGTISEPSDSDGIAKFTHLTVRIRILYV